MQSACNHDDCGTAASKFAAKPGMTENFSDNRGPQLGGVLWDRVWQFEGARAEIVELLVVELLIVESFIVGVLIVELLVVELLIVESLIVELLIVELLNVKLLIGAAETAALNAIAKLTKLLRDEVTFILVVSILRYVCFLLKWCQTRALL